MCKKTTIATLVAMVCSYSQFTFAEQAPTSPSQLAEISVIETADALVQSKVKRSEISQKQARDIKDVLSDSLDVGVINLQTSRSGNDGVNLRGLSGNRVATTIDGIDLPETQEAKHFMSYGMEFGRGDYIEPTALRSAEVVYGGSSNSLSGSVNFSTLETADLLKGRKLGGMVGTGYNSVDNSIYGTLGGAVEIGRYQGMVLTTLRKGHETKTHGDNGGTGETRTEADPVKYRNAYVLTKHQYQLNDNNNLKFTYEHQYKHTDTDLLAKTGTSIDSGTGTQISGEATDLVSRDRFTLQHQYSSDNGWLKNAKTQLYYQDAQTDNERNRVSSTNYRHETAQVKTETYGIKLDLNSEIAGNIAQSLHYGFNLSQTKTSNYSRYQRPAYSSASYSRLGRADHDGTPFANMTQNKFDAYVKDQINLGEVLITPTLAFVHYNISPDQASNIINDSEISVTGFNATKKASETIFTPSLSFIWQIAPEFEPYLQYSRGVRIPSTQQLSSFFHESLMSGAVTVSVVGNPELKAETSHNFELGVKGQNDRLSYVVTGYYNRYKNFIDWVDITSQFTGYSQYVQYQNFDSATIYGLTANAKWKFDQFFVNAGLAYSRGTETNQGEDMPINSVQPLKTRLGVGYEGDQFGANVQWTFNRAKSDSSINGSMYNPTGGYSLFDLGVYWKPIKDLTVTANLNNIFDKKYWNWNDISYLALMNSQTNTAYSPPLTIDATNADRYSAPGRNFNVGIRYEF